MCLCLQISPCLVYLSSTKQVWSCCLLSLHTCLNQKHFYKFNIHSVHMISTLPLPSLLFCTTLDPGVIWSSCFMPIIIAAVWINHLTSSWSEGKKCVCVCTANVCYYLCVMCTVRLVCVYTMTPYLTALCVVEVRAQMFTGKFLWKHHKCVCVCHWSSRGLYGILRIINMSNSNCNMMQLCY